MANAEIINLLALITLVELMVTIGLDVRVADEVGVARNWRMVGQAALANYVCVPAVAVGLLLLFQAQPLVAAGFLIVAVCPGAPYGPPFTALGADRVVSRARAVPGNVLLCSSGHFIRVLAARWLGLQLSASSRYFMLSTASLSAVGYEHELSRPVIQLWNETRHVGL